jgi:hypothetical protein
MTLSCRARECDLYDEPSGFLLGQNWGCFKAPGATGNLPEREWRGGQFSADVGALAITPLNVSARPRSIYIRAMCNDYEQHITWA